MNGTARKVSAGMIILMLASFAYAQQAHFWYVEEPVNPRATGMGCAGTAKSTGGFSFYNPAAVTTSESSFVAFEYGQQWSDIAGGLVETAWLFPKWFVGASFQTQSNTFQPVDDFGNRLPGSGSEQASLLSLQIGWRGGGGRYAIGAAINGLQHHLYDDNAYALSASGGVTVAILPEKLLAGAALIQAGSYHRGFSRTSFEVNRNIMPTTGRFGCSWNDTIIGKLPVTILLDAVYSSNFHTVTLPLGFEIRPLRPLAVRLGKRFNLTTELFTLGIGIFWENLSFDASFIPSTLEGDFESRWLIGLRYALASRKKAAARKKVVAEPLPARETTSGHVQETVPVNILHLPADSSVVPVTDTAAATPPLFGDTAGGVPSPDVDSVNLQTAPADVTPAGSIAPNDATLRETITTGSAPQPPDSSGATAVTTPVTDDNPALPADPSPEGEADSPGAEPGDTRKP